MQRWLRTLRLGLGLGSAISLIAFSAISVNAGPAYTGDAKSTSSTLIFNRLDDLERQNAELRAQIVQLRQSVNNNTQRAAEAQASAAQAAAYKEQKSSARDIRVGVRTGYSDSPYAMPGGYFYGAFLTDRLLTQEDGIPYGTVTGELMASAVLGNNANTNADLANQLVGGSAQTSLTTIEIQPTYSNQWSIASRTAVGTVRRTR